MEDTTGTTTVIITDTVAAVVVEAVAVEADAVEAVVVEAVVVEAVVAAVKTHHNLISVLLLLQHRLQKI